MTPILSLAAANSMATFTPPTSDVAIMLRFADSTVVNQTKPKPREAPVSDRTIDTASTVPKLLKALPSASSWM